MTISLQEVAKKFDRQVIFRNLTYEFTSGHIYGIFGHNGSGKSTLLKVIAGMLTPNKGSVVYKDANGNEVEVEAIYKHLIYSAPYQELFTDLSMKEMLEFHGQFRQWRQGCTAQSVINELGFDEDKLIRDYSSGMYQKLKLAIAVYTQSDILMLDEPTSNFDDEGINWYNSLLEKNADGRIVLVASALKDDLKQCHEVIDVLNYK